MSKFWKVIPILIILSLIFYKITRNKIDPTWKKLEQLDLTKVKTLNNSTNKLDSLFTFFHEKAPNHHAYGLELIAKPYVPLMEFSKFKKFVRLLKKEKKILISSTVGGGGTTLVENIAKFIAIDQTRIMSIKCAPQFDLIYHNKYIGKYVDGHYKKGLLLKFWERCIKNPDQKFIAIFDDFDKINPETLFGPDLWENFNNPKYKLFLKNKEIIVPTNFYMISTTLSATGSRIKLHNEHFKRIGNNYFIGPNTIDLALYLDRKKQKLNTKVKTKGLESLNPKEKLEIKTLNNKRKLLEFLYIFDKTNSIIKEKISRNSQLAQWSNIRKLFLPKNRTKLINTFVNHVNAISPNKKFDNSYFDTIKYTFKNNGLLKGSNSLAQGFKVFKEWGFLTEFVVAICFALITALIGLYLNTKRKRKVTKFLLKSEKVYTDFENNRINPDIAITKLSNLKLEIETNTKENKLSFPEAIFFYNSIRTKVNSIEITKSINATFLTLMDVFLDDKILSKNEYDKLISFLEKIKNTLPQQDYTNMKKQVEQAWADFGEK